METPARHWAGLGLLSAALAAAVLLTGGVYPQSWQWIALAVSAGSFLFFSTEPPFTNTRPGLILLAVLLGWMILFLVPLPPFLVEHILPVRWSATAVARQTVGLSSEGWRALSLAPASTLERLLDVLPAMALFVAAIEMGWRWRDRIWISVVPVVFVACCESVLGLVQFAMMRAAGGDIASSTGTYVNRNHFAGLLEMAFPLAVGGAFAVWNRRAVWRNAVLLTVALLAVAGCLLAGVVVSLSRMGFVSTLFAAVITTSVLAWPRSSSRSPRRHFSWKWIAPFATLLCVLLLLPTKQLRTRFEYMVRYEEVTTDIRVAIWKDTLPLISAHKWTGTGLGTYERGLYPYKTVKPANTLDFAHNDYLQILAELGLVGGLLAFALGAWILWSPVRAAWRGPQVRNWELAAGLVGSLVAIGLHSLTDFNLYIPANALVLAWLAGLAVSPGLREPRPPVPRPSARGLQEPKTARAITCA